MRIDLHTKGVLTVIALLLAVIADRPYVSPNAVALAQGPFAGVLPVESAAGPRFFDTRTGEPWGYANGALESRNRLTKLGAPLIGENEKGGPRGPPRQAEACPTRLQAACAAGFVNATPRYLWKAESFQVECAARDCWTAVPLSSGVCER